MSSKIVRRYLITGLLIWIPLWATISVVKILIDALDKIVILIPRNYQPDTLFGFHLPGVGLVLCFLLLFLTGLMVTHTIGETFVQWGEKLLNRIPLVRSIYQATKQVTETIFSSNSQAFRQVLLVEYPRKGLWSIAFQTAASSKSTIKNGATDPITVFIPTTPNPTSGFLFLVERDDVVELDMSVDEALKMVISLGVVQPSSSCPTATKS